MNSKALVVVIVGALAYGGLIAAHRLYDQREWGDSAASTKAYDASPLLIALQRRGLSDTRSVRDALEKLGEPLAEFLSLIPEENEPWARRFRVIEKSVGQPTKHNPLLYVKFPKGKQVEAPKTLRLSREGVGLAWVELVEELDGGGTTRIAAFKLKVNMRQTFPADAKLEAGRKYRLIVSDSQGKPRASTTHFSIISNNEKKRLQATMAVLRRHVQESRPNIYLQVCVAMSRQLYDHGISLVERLANHPSAASEVGLLERLIFMNDYRGDLVHRDQLLAKLRALR